MEDLEWCCQEKREVLLCVGLFVPGSSMKAFEV